MKQTGKVAVNRQIEQKKKTIPFAIALANKILNTIGFVELINTTVEWDKEQCNVSPGNLLKALILSTFFDIRAPLRQVAIKFQDIDTEFLFGEGILAEHLNDFAIGRALEKFARSNPERNFRTLCLNAYTIFKIAFKRLHADTTTVSFYGEYEIEDNCLDSKIESGLNESCEDATEQCCEDSNSIIEENENLEILRGYNKDHKKECKQVVIGKIVNEHGIPIASSVMNGNTSDVEWNKNAIKMVADIYENDLSKGIFIADCKLVTADIVRTMLVPKKRIKFISRCPASFNNKIEGRMIVRANEDNEWQEIGTIVSGKKAAAYSVTQYDDEFEGTTLRYIVVKSSAGDIRCQNKIEKKRKLLESNISANNKKVFACKEDAIKDYQRFCKSNKNCIFKYDVEYFETRTEKRKKGNPGKNPKPPTIDSKWSTNIKIIGDNIENMSKFKYSEKCFVLITNVTSDECSAEEILKNYKNQMVVEIDFRTFKEPCIASVVYLKNPDRIRAFMIIMSVALLIRALVQYKMRKGLSEYSEVIPHVGRNGRKLQHNPTIKFLCEALMNQYFVKDSHLSYSYTFSNQFVELQIMTLLRLLGFTVEDLLS